jgi:hypothetical protein
MITLTFWASMLCTMLYGYAVGYELMQTTQIACGIGACTFAYWNRREIDEVHIRKTDQVR